MSYVNSTRVANNGLGDRFAAIVKSLKVGLQRRRVYNQTLRELNILTERELTDLGIHRSAITRIAMEAAYGK